MLASCESPDNCFSCITYPSEHGARQLVLLYVNNVGLSLCNVDVPMDLVARHVGHSLNYHLTFRFRHSFVDWPQERCTNQTTLLLRYFHSVQGPTARRLRPLFPNIISLDQLSEAYIIVQRSFVSKTKSVDVFVYSSILDREESLRVHL